MFLHAAKADKYPFSNYCICFGAVSVPSIIGLQFPLLRAPLSLRCCALNPVHRAAFGRWNITELWNV